MYFILVQIVTFWCFLTQIPFRSRYGPDKDYEEWQKKYPQESTSLLYHSLSREAWAYNFYYVQRHNSNPFNTFQMALGKIGDRTHKEYIDIYLKSRYGVSVVIPDRPPDFIGMLVGSLDFNMTEPVPQQVNYALHKPEDQVSCGACYIFSALAVLEYHMAKLLRVPDIRLSVQYVIDCGLQHNLQGCQGGNPLQVYSFIHTHGIIESQYYTYSAREGTCNLTPFQKTKILRPSINYTARVNIKAQDVKKILHHSGPVVIAFDAEPLEFFLYGSGVLETSCGPGSRSNHAVALMGYGLDEATNKEYILLQNSMGPTWGENGFFRMPLGKNICLNHARWAIIPAHSKIVTLNIFVRCARQRDRRAAARARMDPELAVYWYNVGMGGTEALFRYPRRFPDQLSVSADLPQPSGELSEGTPVFVRPASGTCTESWRVGTVTSVAGDRPEVVEVDGIPRHRSHVREVPVEPEERTVRRSQRTRIAPSWHADYDL
ncbi:hypothetical protein Ciccas_011702 [Cichlidogyrus casuarinus]|uniref:Uncharacterized protein n=1 Tax=Cichlidogyrus casuarinus TaxID=1844966 RepID=A0ABD2PQJ1_9PLAT